MGTTLVRGVAIAACLATGCDLSDPAPAAHEPGQALASAGPPRGTYVVVDPDDVTSRSNLAAPGGDPLIIFLNRNGGTYTPGRNDSRINRSSIVQRASLVPPWNVTDDGWRQVVTCIQGQFARWNVVVTDVDPGNTPHLESVIAGDPADVGQGDGVGGVSPFALDCSVIDNSIVYTFAEVFGRSYRTVCDVAAQEIAHSFGLDHERLCSDPMTYMPSCGAKSFQDQAVACGEYEDRECACGEPTQNSVAILTRVLGLKASNQAPLVAITAPADGAEIGSSVTVRATASDDTAVVRVELWIDGSKGPTDTAAPFELAAAALATGGHDLEVRAFDATGASATDAIAVTVSDDVTPEDPPDPEDPTDPPADPEDPADPPGDPGDPPADDPGSPADPGAGPGDVVGGCAAGGGSTGAATVLVLGVLVGAARVRRRR